VQRVDDVGNRDDRRLSERGLSRCGHGNPGFSISSDSEEAYE
jgi:hypothetical protein